MLPGIDAKPLRREWLNLFRRAMANGGAAQARSALGSSAVGDAVFIASTTATARAAIGLSGGVVIDRAYAEYTANASITTTIPLDDTIPQNTEGTEILSVSLTPKSVTSRVRLRFQGQVVCASLANFIAAAFSSGSANALRSTWDAFDANYPGQMVLEHEYVPGVTTALTFSVRVGTSAGLTIRLNGQIGSRLFGGTSAATLVVEEITP
jgi:hypothetical protein